MKKLPLLFLAGLVSISHADCMFKIINYTDSSITAKVGFYRGIASTVLVEPASTAIESIPSVYLCNSSAANGLGVSYISFTKDPDYGGANYSPISKHINLMGAFKGDSSDGRIVRADNGTPMWLNATDLAVNDSVFEIKLNFTGRPNSYSAGTQ